MRMLTQCMILVSIIMLVSDAVFLVHRILRRNVTASHGAGSRFLNAALIVCLAGVTVFFCIVYHVRFISWWIGALVFSAAMLFTLTLIWAFMQADGRARENMELLETVACVIESGDPNLDGHSIHVRNLTMLLYDNLPLSYRLSINRENLRYAALLLDIGKLGIPRSIITKGGKLSPQEWALVRRHPDLAAQVLEHIKGFGPVAAWIRFHHERVDGTGYHHLKKEQIPLASRIIAVADTYSAITMDRSYKASMPYLDAVTELRRASGTQLDSELVEFFCRIPQRKVEDCMADVIRKMEPYQNWTISE